MDNYGADYNGELNRLITELTQGRDLVQQLQLHLNAPFSSSPETTRDFLLHSIQSKFDKALSMLNPSNSLTNSNSAIIPNMGMSDSPRSFTASPPHSEDSDRDLEPKDSANRKRKSSIPRWTKQVQVCPGAPIEGNLDDGFSWRKYGQKDILGAKYPRGYYRCTLRHVQGCFATKQVQRSDEDPTIFEVTYRGTHTCNQANPTPVTIPQIQEPNLGNEHQRLNSVPHQNPHEILLMNFQKDLNISKHDFNFNATPNNVSFESFASSSHVKADQDYNLVPNTMIPLTNNFVENLSPAFNMSPGTNSGSSSYFAMTSSQMNNSSQDYQFNSMGYESNFPFDYQGFSS